MSRLLAFQNFYLVGIKGVAMTALAQCLLDAGKSVRGSDVAEEFVTQKLLDQRQIVIDPSFDAALPAETECVIYTAAHNSQDNPQVKAASAQNLPTFTHAEAVADLFNDNKGVAVCGVGGKSTTSAMITWILEKLGYHPNFAIGVGDIPGLEKTGQWHQQAEFFIAEADEYVTDPSAPSRGEEITPRFSFMRPFVTVCTNLRHDHPDVYKDFDQTKKQFAKFFDQVQTRGTLIANIADQSTLESLPYWSESQERQLVWFGETAAGADLSEDPASHPSFILDSDTFWAQNGQTSCVLVANHLQFTQRLQLQLPGMYNLRNAAAAVAACWALGVDVPKAVAALASFQSTLRRSQFIGEKNGVRYYDDYAHHPHEVHSVIHAYREWFPDRKLVVAFQSHTFTRTKQFFTEFIDAFAEANEVVMIDIFPSAREAFDPSVTSDQLCQAIATKYPTITTHNYQTLEKLAEFCKTQLRPGDVCLTIGAGDIYQVHDLIQA